MKRIIAGFLFLSIFFNAATLVPSQLWYVADSYSSILAQERTTNKRLARPFSEAPEYNSMLASAAQEATPAVVSILFERDDVIGIGSGFIFSEDGYILTNKHVVPYVNARYTVVLHDDTKRSAKVVYRDPVYDIAVVKIAGTYNEIIPLGDSDDLERGESVAAIGNVLGLVKNTVSTGTIEGFNRTVRAEGLDEEIETFRGLIETDAYITQGFSGGPLIDETGAAIGMNMAATLNNSSSFAIPVDIIRERIEDFV